MSRVGTAGRFALAVACAGAVALTPAAARPDDATRPPEDAATPAPAPASPRRWRLSAVTLGFADDFLGVPRTRLNDDNGFVADLRLTGELTDGDRRTARLVASEQIITERGGPRRVDDGKLYVEWERAPGSRRGITIVWLAGIDLIGDLGGGGLQDWAHRTVFTGRVLGGAGSQQLQDRYPARMEVLGLAGGRLHAVRPLRGPFSLRGGVEAALGAGTGFFAELHPYVAVGVTLGPVDLELREGAGSYWTTIRPLTMPGGYVTRLLQSEPSARLVLTGPRWLPAVLGVQLDWNSGNTSQHVGGLVVGSRF